MNDVDILFWFLVKDQGVLMPTILSRNLPDPLSVFHRTLEEVKEKNHLSNFHISQL